MRARVTHGKTTPRPEVALLCATDQTFADILQCALDFDDVHRKEEADIERLLESPVDVVLRHRDGDEFRVLPTCDVSGALLYGDFQFVEFQLRVSHLSPPARVALLALAQLLTHHLPVL